jgi:hypothetical protein
MDRSQWTVNPAIRWSTRGPVVRFVGRRSVHNDIMTMDVEIEIGPGLRYVEVVGSSARGLPMRRCRLFSGELPVSELEVVSFRQRFGAVSVAAEGIGGVETQLEFRRRGHVSRLLRQVVIGMARRVDVGFVSDAIEGLYETFGFVNALAEGRLVIPVRTVERALGDLAADNVRDGTVDDLPAAVALYNDEHRQRPWTHDRPSDWNRMRPHETWRPGTRMLAHDVDGALAGYAFLPGRAFGDDAASMTVEEMTARDPAAARTLLAAVAKLCWSARLSEFAVLEPADGLVGRVARQLGCGYRQDWPPNGGMMAAILNRAPLLDALEPELRRRAGHTDGLAGLARADQIADDRALIRLLLGTWSAVDAQIAGMPIDEAWRDRFPGGGTPRVLMPYAHRLDRY